MKNLLAIAATAASVAVVSAENWAVLICGSNGYGNYRHHADLCHAYKILTSNGVPDSNIITLLYDDVANDPANPFPGKLFNKPTTEGNPGVDVYTGCKKSYTGNDVTAANVLAILTGNASAVTGGSGEVLKSGPDDHVFVNFVDHGAAGLVAMPVGPYLYGKDLNEALVTMHKAKMYKQLTFYLEACESGSMFEGVLADDVNIYATTAANPDESSWGTYCPPDDMVDGVAVGSCLGDLYSVNWMEDSDASGHMKQESLQTQYETVRDMTNLSHVMQYGEVDWTDEMICEFEAGSCKDPQPAPAVKAVLRSQGAKAIYPTVATASARMLGQVNASAAARTRAARAASMAASSVSSRMATLTSLQARAAAGDAAAAAELQAELRAIRIARRAFSTIAGKYLGAAADADAAAAVPVTVTQWACYKGANQAVEQSCGRYTDTTLRYARVAARFCEATHGDAAFVAAEVKEACYAAVAAEK